MRTLSELEEITAKIRQTLENVMEYKSLRTDCHFSHMIGNFVLELQALKCLRRTYGEVETKRAVSGILREINDYFVALGMNDKFREYEFLPAEQLPEPNVFYTTKEGLIGYTDKMMPKFENQ